ncbi:MAG TPA: fumarylacetoacetate hydrolase family protein [Opitutaceae bacterium]|nr:fumarylacetoacetate hydrolase family protein [Opitutaceae bacterium]
MRLATIIPKDGSNPLPVVESPKGGWIQLSSLLTQSRTGFAEHLQDFLTGITLRTEDLKRRATEWSGPRVVSAEKLLSPVPRPPAFRDFYAFEQHVKTARAKRGLAMVPAWYDIPVFYFSNHNSLVGDDAAVHAPAGSNELDYELELGVVIGRTGRDISVEQAWSYVAGFTIINDLSARDLQRAEMSVGLGPAKGKDFATAVGPYLVTIDEFSDVIQEQTLSLDMRACVNGRELSRGNVSALYHSIPRLIAQASQGADLFPGDLIGSGTVGTGCILELGPENTGGWLKPGDVVELEIERLGILRTRIVERNDGTPPKP